MMRRLLALTLSLALLGSGCNTGSREDVPKPGSTAGGSTSGGSTAAASLNVTAQPAASPARIGPEVVALVVDLQSAGSSSVDLAALTVTASGSVDESTTIGAVKLIGDDNKNGLIDVGEATLATSASPAFTVDDGTTSLSLASPISIAGGASLQVIVAVEVQSAGGSAAAQLIGKTIQLAVATPADIAVTSAGAPVTAGGTFPASSGPVSLALSDHLLLTEVNSDGWDEEFIEIFNPTAQAIDLSNVYYTDATDSARAEHYFNLPSGVGFGPANGVSDFLARFPQGATIQPGAVVVVATDADAFATVHGRNPDYCLRNPAGTGAVPMLTWDGSAWVTTGVNYYAELLDDNEMVMLFTWDGQSDLVQDLDYVFFGAATSYNFPIDKTGTSVDGPDAGSTATPYLGDTPEAQQTGLTFVTGQSFLRVDFTEQGEQATGGNGLTGHDETSEPWATTWTTGTPTPGVP